MHKSYSSLTDVNGVNISHSENCNKLDSQSRSARSVCLGLFGPRVTDLAVKSHVNQWILTTRAMPADVCHLCQPVPFILCMRCHHTRQCVRWLAVPPSCVSSGRCCLTITNSSSSSFDSSVLPARSLSSPSSPTQWISGACRSLARDCQYAALSFLSAELLSLSANSVKRVCLNRRHSLRKGQSSKDE